MWRRTAAGFAVVVAVVIVAAVVVTGHQRSTFRGAMERLEEETSALIELEQELLAARDPMVTVMYRTGPPEAVAEAEAALGDARTRVDARFSLAREAVHTSAELDVIGQAHARWSEIGGIVDASVTEYTDDELSALVRSGNDPFTSSVWDRWDAMERSFADLRTDVAADMSDHVMRIEEDSQRVLLPVLIGTGSFVLLLGYLASRRITRRVIRPLARLDDQLRAFADSGTFLDVEPIEGSVVEVANLVRTLHDAGRSLQASQELLHRQAHTDSLTDLPNRKAFGDHLTATLESSPGDQLAIMFIDLDDFKDVNDTLGHAAGDELLQIIGERLRFATRDGDLVGRLGGDEFAVAVRVGPDRHDPTTVADRVLEAISLPVDLFGTQVHVGCSIGIAVGEPGPDAGAAERLLANADFAMYLAKSQGKQRYEVYSATLHAEMLSRLDLRRDLVDALGADQLELHYQPIFALDDNRLRGYEALLRWNHPTHGQVPPAEFIGIAEDSGSIVEIGRWVMDQACATLAQLHRDDPDLYVSVNVSPVQIASATFVRDVVDATRTHGVAPDRFVIEITEETAMTNTAEEAVRLEELRAHGIHIALDDFGTGFSSLRYLSTLPVDFIKIDRSFISGHDHSDREMLDTIVTLAQRLGLHVIAEGIETPDDLERLGPYDDVAGQGFLLGRPSAATWRPPTGPPPSRRAATAHAPHAGR